MALKQSTSLIGSCESAPWRAGLLAGSYILCHSDCRFDPTVR